MKIFNQKI